MNFRRLRPRVNYPLMKKGGPHVMSRKKHRRDAQKETQSLLSEVLNEEEKPDGETQN
jgi:hypothetical protein